MKKEQIENLIEAYVELFPHLFLVELRISPSNAIEVLMDSDKGITIGECKQLSRKIENHAEENEWDISILVSSPGIDYPLRSERQFRKNLNRKLKVQLKTENKPVEGNLVAVEEHQIVLKWKARIPKEIGKGKQTVEMTKEISLEDIDKANVVLSFK